MWQRAVRLSVGTGLAILRLDGLWIYSRPAANPTLFVPTARGSALPTYPANLVFDIDAYLPSREYYVAPLALVLPL